jgi:hypothetical protein
VAKKRGSYTTISEPAISVYTTINSSGMGPPYDWKLKGIMEDKIYRCVYCWVWCNKLRYRMGAGANNTSNYLLWFWRAINLKYHFLQFRVLEHIPDFIQFHCQSGKDRRSSKIYSEYITVIAWCVSAQLNCLALSFLWCICQYFVLNVITMAFHVLIKCILKCTHWHLHHL